ncbi:34159_t:CDS:1, partial [Racocetra persica]
MLIFLFVTIKESTANPLLKRGAEKKCYDYVFATSTFCDGKFS